MEQSSEHGEPVRLREYSCAAQCLAVWREQTRGRPHLYYMLFERVQHQVFRIE